MVSQLSPRLAPVPSGLAGRRDSDPAAMLAFSTAAERWELRRQAKFPLAACHCSECTPTPTLQQDALPCGAVGSDKYVCFCIRTFPGIGEKASAAAWLCHEASASFHPSLGPWVMITLVRWLPGLRGQEGAEMKGSPAAYQHQRLRNHTTPGNQSSVSPSGLILALCPVYAIPEWEEVRYS